MLSLSGVLPLGAAEFAARLEALARFETPPLLAVAVSGGPDSLAVALLADEWARAHGGASWAVSVDHRLRPESAAEMHQLSFWLSARSIRHEVLVWGGEKPRAAIQEAARAARYQFLAQWCRQRGCLHLLTGHHREDQIETHLLRLAASSGAVGLAAMPAIRELGGCRILRPLLDIPKARLAATLAARGQPFLTDPSNSNPAFARARLRAAAAVPAVNGAAASALDGIRALGRERVLCEQSRDRLLARTTAVHPAGFAAFDLEPLLSAPPDIAERALAALVYVLGGAAYPPRRGSVRRLLRALAGKAAGSRTLGGFRFVAWRGRVLVFRELAHAAGSVRVMPGSTLLWDRRFAAASPAAAPPLVLDYLGPRGVAEWRRATAGARPRLPLPALLHPILPGLWDEKGLAAVPSIGYRREGGIVLPRLSFRPVNSLSHASFAVA